MMLRCATLCQQTKPSSTILLYLVVIFLYNCGPFHISNCLCDSPPAVKWKHQSLKPQTNQSTVRMHTSMTVQLITLSSRLCQR